MRGVFAARYADLMYIFRSYCSRSDPIHDCSAMFWNDFSAICSEAGMTDANSNYCRQRDIDKVFIAVNSLQDESKEQKTINNSVSLMRFEFLDALVRVALAKYGYPTLQLFFFIWISLQLFFFIWIRFISVCMYWSMCAQVPDLGPAAAASRPAGGYSFTLRQRRRVERWRCGAAAVAVPRGARRGGRCRAPGRGGHCKDLRDAARRGAAAGRRLARAGHRVAALAALHRGVRGVRL